MPLSDVLAAAAAATRGAPVDIRRKRSATRSAFLQLAHHQGWRSTKQLADLCGMSARSVLEQWEKHDEEILHAAALCLGDSRLRAASEAHAKAFLQRTNPLRATPQASRP